MAATSGAISYIQYGWEGTFGTVTSSYDKVFGKDVKFNKTSKNDFKKGYGIGSRDISSVTPGMFSGSATIDFTFANPWFTRAVLGAAPVTTSSSPFIHTYTPSDTLTPFSVELGHELGGTDSVIDYLGCLVNTCKLVCAIGEPIKVSLDILYINEAEDATLDATPASESFTEMFFAFGSLNIGGVLTRVQEVTLTIDNGVILRGGIGSRINSAQIAGERKYTLSFRKTYEDDDELEVLYGQAGSPIDDTIPAQGTGILIFDNGLAGANERKITFNLANVYFDEHSQDISVDVLEETVVAFAKTISTAIATNATTPAP